MTRHDRNEHVMRWIRAIISNGGSLLTAAGEDKNLYHLGAYWAVERGYIKKHGTVDVIGHTPRRYAYTMNGKGMRVAAVFFRHGKL